MNSSATRRRTPSLHGTVARRPDAPGYTHAIVGRVGAHEDGEAHNLKVAVESAYVYFRKSGDTAIPNSMCLRMRPTSRAALIGAGSF